MTANVTKLEDNKVRLDVEVPPEAVRQGVEAKVRELGRQVRVPGFRPGKAPMRGQFATLAAVEDRPVQSGDFVIIDFRGEMITTGEPLKGGQAEDYMLEIGRNQP